MGLFDFLKRGAISESISDASNIPENEKKYYQPDEYYKTDTPFRHVITFDERKETCIPSKRGLFVAEILLLQYCTYGTYPAPPRYPGFWWFEYGIRNVGAALRSLEKRRFIQLENGRYTLTLIGEAELKENAYVPYMHNNKNTTLESHGLGTGFNVWSINQLLGRGDKDNWRALVDAEEKKVLDNWGKPDDPEMDAFIQEQLDAGEMMLVATLDLHTCPACARRDHVRIRNSKEAPPCHPGCRCFSMPRMTEAQLAKIRRFARDPVTGKGITVPGNMNYIQWREKYVDCNEIALENAEIKEADPKAYPYYMTQVLAVIRQNPGVLQKDLHVDGISKSSISSTIRQLVSTGKITRERDGNTYALYAAK